MLKELVPLRVWLTWILLIALTLVGPSLLGMEAQNSGYVAMAIMTIAVVKIRMIGSEFMELRHAPLKLSLVFDGFCLLLWLILASPFLPS